MFLSNIELISFHICQKKKVHPIFNGLTTYNHIYNRTNNITWIFQKSTANYITFINLLNDMRKIYLSNNSNYFFICISTDRKKKTLCNNKGFMQFVHI